MSLLGPRLWRPDSAPPPEYGVLRRVWFYFWECQDRDLKDWPYRHQVGFALMVAGGLLVSLALRELL